MTNEQDFETLAAGLTPLTPAVFHILLALGGGSLHGYGIMLEVEKFTHGQMSLGAGTLYRSIQRMQGDGLIEEDPSGPSTGDDERRRNYRLTPLGTHVARDEASRLAQLVEVSKQKGILPKKGKHI